MSPSCDSMQNTAQNQTWYFLVEHFLNRNFDKLFSFAIAFWFWAWSFFSCPNDIIIKSLTSLIKTDIQEVKCKNTLQHIQGNMHHHYILAWCKNTSHAFRNTEYWYSPDPWYLSHCNTICMSFHHNIVLGNLPSQPCGPKEFWHGCLFLVFFLVSFSLCLFDLFPPE